MFGNKRYDDTQRLFDTFISYRTDKTPLAFSTNGVVVLTTNGVVYRDLIGTEMFREAKKEKEERAAVVEHKPLGLGEHEISRDIILRKELKNAVLFDQLEGVDEKTGRKIGGIHTIILSDEPTKLKRFIVSVVRQHLNHVVTIENRKRILNSSVGELISSLSIDNKLVYEGCVFDSISEIEKTEAIISKVIDLEVAKKNRNASVEEEPEA